MSTHEILSPEVTPSGLGLIQQGSYIYVVSGCCDAMLDTHIASLEITHQTCGACDRKLEGAPLSHTSFGLASIETRRARRYFEDFVRLWTGFEEGDILLHFEWPESV